MIGEGTFCCPEMMGFFVLTLSPLVEPPRAGGHGLVCNTARRDGTDSSVVLQCTKLKMQALRSHINAQL